jgi:hypothetical protein
MFGFGDDRNPSNDTVNVMEEILVEYIADVVSVFSASVVSFQNDQYPVSNCPRTNEEVPPLNRGFPQGVITTGRREEACTDGGVVVHARGY